MFTISIAVYRQAVVLTSHAILRLLFRWSCEPLSLAGYETSITNRFHLASYVWLDSLACQALDAFHIRPRQSLRFCLHSRSWTYSSFFNREILYHWVICNLQWCAASVAPHSFGMQNTTHHVPFVSRTTQRRFTIDVLTSHDVAH